jgi:hypothetical protein
MNRFCFLPDLNMWQQIRTLIATAIGCTIEFPSDFKNCIYAAYSAFPAKFAQASLETLLTVRYRSIGHPVGHIGEHRKHSS